jgi:hypothetical protein
VGFDVEVWDGVGTLLSSGGKGISVESLVSLSCPLLPVGWFFLLLWSRLHELWGVGGSSFLKDFPFPGQFSLQEVGVVEPHPGSSLLHYLPFSLS